jgi:hypothetical protein
MPSLRSLAALAVALTSCFVLTSAPASACERAPSPTPERPVTLRDKAERLLLQAASHEREADTLTSDASRLAVRANQLRDRASRLAGQTRAELLADAARLDSDAADERAEAADLRLVAVRLREEARELTRLASNPRPPGWRGRPLPTKMVAID